MYRKAPGTGASKTVGEKTAQDVPQGPAHIASVVRQPAQAMAIGPSRTDATKTSTTTGTLHLMEQFSV
jgi:hypothetical protein